MVQVLKARGSFGSEFGKALGTGLGEGTSESFAKAVQLKQDKKKMDEENAEILKDTGIRLTSKNQKLREIEFNQKLKDMQENAQEKRRSEEFKKIFEAAGYGENKNDLSDIGNEPDQETIDRPQGILKPEFENPTENKPKKSNQSRKNQLIPPELIMKTAATKNLGGLAARMQGLNDELTRNERHTEDLNWRKTEAARKERSDIHALTQKYDEELLKNTKTAKKQTETIKDIEKAIKSGNVNPKSAANIFRGMGPIGDKIATALLNGDQSTVLSSIPALLEGWKDVFGVRLSDADLKLLGDKLPDIGKSVEANKAVLRILKKYGQQTLLRSQIANEIKEKNGGYRPLGYAEQIEKRYDEMIQPVMMRAPSGKITEIPAYQVGEAVKANFTVVNQDEGEEENE